jgi:hypothetical protein
VAVQAVDSTLNFGTVRNFNNVRVAVRAGKHFMHLLDESSIIVVYPRSVTVFGSGPFKSRMAHHASFVVAQILGIHQYAEAKTGNGRLLISESFIFFIPVLCRNCSI